MSGSLGYQTIPTDALGPRSQCGMLGHLESPPLQVPGHGVVRQADDDRFVISGGMPDHNPAGI